MRNFKNIGGVVRKVRRRLGYKSQRFDSFVRKGVPNIPDECYSPSHARGRVAKTIVPRGSFAISTLGALEWQGQAKRQLRELLGEPQDSMNLSNVTSLWTARDKLGTYEKILCTDESGTPIPMYLCEPLNKRQSRGWMICVQGHNSGMHNSIGTDAATEQLRIDVAKGSEFVKFCFRHGFSALCVELSCFGERAERHQNKRSPHPCHDAALGALILGRTLMAERVSDVKTAIQFIKKTCNEKGETPYIGIMGNSLGGTLAIYAAAIIDDLQFAIAGSCVASFRESLLKIYHCADLYIPKICQFFEFSDILGMCAPKPIAIIQGRHDPIFPLSSCISEIKSAREVFNALGNEDDLILKVGDGGHQFYADLASDAISELGSRV